MKQVIIQKGSVVVEQVPAPALRPGFVLVQVRASLLSAGTERAAVAASGTGLVQRATKQPRKVLKALRMAKERGVMSTWRVVAEATASGGPIGYSNAGVVTGLGEGISDLAIGDRVACAGAGYANHAEFVCVPRNLVARVPDGVADSQACTTTVGAIALQGVRRANLQLGERAVVVGLGVIGQITVQLLRASGVRVFAVDLDPERVSLAQHLGAEAGEAADSTKAVSVWTAGFGADAVLLTAATPSDEPVAQAMQMVRKRGKVVVVGDVGLHLTRSPFYEKEAELLISCSYGPGRYDPEYEEEGLDYPYAFARWTENRNMEAYLNLLATKQVRVEELRPVEFAIDEADKAYATLRSPSKAMVVVLRYPQTDQPEMKTTLALVVNRGAKRGRVGIGVIGGGGFALGTHLPNLALLSAECDLVHVSSRNGFNALKAGRLFHSMQVSTDPSAVLSDPRVDAVVISSQHDAHAELAVAAAAAGKGVFLEKPVGLTPEEVDDVLNAISKARVPFTVGYNRRFAPATAELRRQLQGRKTPMVCAYRVNGGFIPNTHWIQGPKGGGRIIGEMCHMVDFTRSITSSALVGCTATAIRPSPPYRSDDNLSASLRFKDGSVATITYVANGPAGLPKEAVEVFWDGRGAQLGDFTRLEVFGARGGWHGAQDKGHLELMRSFLAHCNGGPPPIALSEIREVSTLTFDIAAEVSGGQ